MKINVEKGNNVYIGFNYIEVYNDNIEKPTSTIYIDDKNVYFGLYINGEYTGQLRHCKDGLNSLILKNVVEITDGSIYMVI